MSPGINSKIAAFVSGVRYRVAQVQVQGLLQGTELELTNLLQLLR